MKKIFFSVFVLAVMASCTNQRPEPIEIKGNIQNLNTGFALIESKGLSDTVWVKDDGNFAYTSELISPQYYTIRAGRIRHRIFMCPGTTSVVNFDTEDVQRIATFEGENAMYNMAIREVNKVFEGLNRNFADLYQLPKEDFMVKLDSALLEVEGIISPFNRDKKPFAAFERARAKYTALGLLANYPAYHAHFSGQQLDSTDIDYSFMDAVDLKNMDHFGIDEYMSLVDNHMQRLYNEIMHGDKVKGASDFEKTLMYFEFVDSLIGKGVLADYFNYSETKEAIRWLSLEAAKNISEHYLENAQSEDYKKSVKALIDKRMLLAPGQPAPKFTLEGFDGKTYSLDDFKGKLVYLDFWATWCGPCRREIPHLKQLKEEYKGKPIAFIAISVDDDKEAWEKMVKNDKLDGIQLYAPKAWLNEVTIQYQVVGIPTFVLIDGEGKIIEYPAPRPSQEETKLIIDKHLKLL